MCTIDGANAESQVGHLGFGDQHLVAYRALLGRGALTVTQLALLTGDGERDLRLRLRRLARQGAVLELALEPPTYWAVPPEVAFAEQVAKRELLLTEVRESVLSLAAIHQRRLRDSALAAVVEHLEGTDTVSAGVAYLLGAAREQVRMAVPVCYESAIGLPVRLLRELRARGVTIQLLCAHGDSAHTSSRPQKDRAVDELRGSAELDHAWFIVVDADAAFVLAEPGGDPPTSGLIIRHGPLVSALAALFGKLWVDAWPLWPTGITQATAMNARDRQLLEMLNAGLTNTAMASRLSVNVRTIERRVENLFRRLGVRTRFQAGVVVARRGWL